AHGSGPCGRAGGAERSAPTVRGSASRARTRPRPIPSGPPLGVGGLRRKREESLNPTGCFAWQLPVIVASSCASDDAPWLFSRTSPLLQNPPARRGLTTRHDLRSAAR